ncbi:MAG: hypothetical protein KGV44_01275 [Flavobacteriaceae bacterium]|nr:hypothetical protein [Flavobacteriaceae bacterium]
MEIRILDEAQWDLEFAFEFYEIQREGLGGYFLENLLLDIESLISYKGLQIKQFGYFRLLSKKFPYAIYYLINGDFIDVYAVLDCRQNPMKIVDKLKERNKTNA